MFLLLKSFPYIVYHPFQVMKNINGSIPNIQYIKNIKKEGHLGYANSNGSTLKAKFIIK